MKTMTTFDDVVESHGPAVLRLCASILGPGPEAEDAWAETFLAALTAFPFAEGVSVEAWLVRVARHKSIDIVRSRRRTHPLDPQEMTAVGDRAVTPTDLDDELWNHVAELTPRQRFVVAHRFIAQWTYPEIAEKLQCSPAAARRTGADAIAALRRRLNAREDIR